MNNKKKILSMGLATTMVIGGFTTAFATPTHIIVDTKAYNLLEMDGGTYQSAMISDIADGGDVYIADTEGKTVKVIDFETGVYATDFAAAPNSANEIVGEVKVVNADLSEGVAIEVPGRDQVQEGELEVTDVSAINARELVVAFNQPIDKLTAEVEANYVIEVNNSALATTAYAATVDADDDTKVNVLLNEASTLDTGDYVDFKVKKEVLSKTLKSLEADATEAFSFVDTTAPVVTGIEVDGNDVKVTFNEYLTAIDLIKINGVSVSVPSLATHAKEITLANAASGLAEGTHTITFANVADNQSTPNTAVFLSETFTTTVDNSAPVVSKVEAVDSDTFKVTFSKNVTTPTVTVKKSGLSLNASVSGSNKEYTVDVSDNGGVKLYDTNETAATLEVNISAYKDAVNNIVGDTTTTNVELSKDGEAPTVVSRFNEIVDKDATPAVNEVFNIQFSEVLGSSNAAKIILKDKDGIKQAIDSAAVVADTDGNNTILQIESAAIQTTGEIDPGTYTLELAAGAVEDSATNANAAATVTFTKEGAIAPAITPTISASGATISINYNTDMTDSAIKLENYKIDNVALPTGTIIYFETDNQHVKIELPDESIEVSEDVLFGIDTDVLSTVGGEIASASLNTVLPGLKDNVDPVLVSAKKVNGTTIELTFSEDLDTYTDGSTYQDDFVVTVNGLELTISATAGASDKVTLTVDNYNVDQEVEVKTADASMTLADAEGNTVVAKTTVTATK